MLTQEQVLDRVKAKDIGHAIDGRDLGRLADFFPVEQWGLFGFEQPTEPVTQKPWTQEAVLEQLRGDLAFAIEKAEGQRGISASCMFHVVCMWLHVLEDPMVKDAEHDNYGLAFFRDVARKYGWPAG